MNNKEKINELKNANKISEKEELQLILLDDIVDSIKRLKLR